jgi:hypothetical protein
MQADVSAVPDVDLGASLAKLKKYQARRRLKKAINAVRVTVRTRMLFAAKAAKAAMEAGADEEKVQEIFFQAARSAPAAQNVAPPVIVLPPPLPGPAPVPVLEGKPQQFRVAAMLAPSAVETRAPAGLA